MTVEELESLKHMLAPHEYHNFHIAISSLQSNLLYWSKHNDISEFNRCKM